MVPSWGVLDGVGQQVVGDLPQPARVRLKQRLVRQPHVDVESLLAALTMGVDAGEVGHCLDRVGLDATAAKRRVRAYCSACASGLASGTRYSVALCASSV